MKLVLATRKSALALAQARAYARALEKAHPGLEVQELHVITSGDRFQDRPLQDIGGKGLFVKEIEEAMLEGKADFAVHSMKDMPAEQAPGLAFAAYPEREDARDVLVTRDGGGLTSLRQGAKVGTSSLRRKVQLLAQRDDLVVDPLRGNVDTRLRKLKEGLADAVVLAHAGLRRLSLAGHVAQVLEPELMLPAVGQGALGIECRADDERVRALLLATDHSETRIRVTAERGFMQAVGGNCKLPVGAYCLRREGEMWLRGMLADEDGSNVRFGERVAPWHDDAGQAEQVAARIGRELGEALRA